MFFGYRRVSTAEQAADGTTSLAEQERILRGLAMAKGFTGFDVQIFTDAGVSGSIHMKYRPAGRDLLEIVKPGDTVAASKLDRMFRNSLDALNVYTDFKERGIDLILFDFGAEPVTKEGALAKVLYQVVAAFADFDRERICERMLEGKAAKRQRGGHVGGLAPFGFKIEGEGRAAKLVPHDEEQQLIRFVQDSELPPGELTKRLNDLGHRCRSGKPFQVVQVLRMKARDVSSVAH